MKTHLKSLSGLKLLLLISLWIAPLMPYPTAPVQLTGGQVRGSIDRDGTHLEYLGIPYATVKHRFQEAEPNPTWEGVFQARNEHVRCEQRFAGSRGKYNKVPVIIGFNNEEGYYFTGRENKTTLANVNFYDALPRDLVFPTDEEKINTAKMLDELYMGGEKITEEKDSLRKFSRFEGDSTVIYPVVATMELFLRTLNKPVFAYKFQYDGLLNYVKMAFGFRGSPGATHGDELFYFNPTPASSSILPKWEPAELQEPKLMVIDKELSMAPIWEDKTHALQLWNTTYSMYRKTRPEEKTLCS
uniref:Carboxylesterase type B domain-containing protein n=1 Tax=Heliothis virescens TaxID=7102 RepID=A0A2A4J2S5_HELVI